uniref:Beta-1,4-galactosyltransferase n=1 Tax=Rattus norvegicus TaxID=10116 RepID=A0ABK0M5H4_RAT
GTGEVISVPKQNSASSLAGQAVLCIQVRKRGGRGFTYFSLTFEALLGIGGHGQSRVSPADAVLTGNIYPGGQNKLVFKPDLTLEEVQAKNPKVSRGRYRPEECKALQRVAVLIPHRNREKHLIYLLEHLHPFLQRQQLDYGIYVIHQTGSKKFNRAKLLNVGYLEALKEENWDCFIFHDVDLVPENDFNLYTCGDQPKHLVVGRNSTGYRLRYSKYFGGVTALSREQFFKVNGFSNNYWGWGGEDDDLRLRVELHKMKISRPKPDVGKYTMIFHTRDKGNEVNGSRMKLLQQMSRVWKTDGLSSCSYRLLSVEHNPLYANITVDFWTAA